MSEDQDDDYEVGYGKPPKNGMFKKGQSGNPKGRQKRVKNFKTELKDVLGSKVTVTVNGKPKLVSTVEAALMRLKDKALKGDARALSILLSYAEQNSNSSENSSRERGLSKLEQELFDRSGLFDQTGDTDGAGND
ncbi:hypothetical protein OAN307_c07690 [Octadecabacter antarcticus 307]|uniref:DUF5681 domain-containing protein n=1 Tax=Octadecabacter antarcticus 307 TaxID=391626 RepID=M9R1K8_9RHOB|nr:DUF5681 domain-containing protein [Octadecabacter antarcticus]AGI66494.1 hypothetical protein OAN307_c07690 [Octadecabacter antarcticus 307]